VSLKNQLPTQQHVTYDVTVTVESAGAAVTVIDGYIEHYVVYLATVSILERPDFRLVLRLPGSVDDGDAEVDDLQNALHIVPKVVGMPSDRGDALARRVSALPKGAVDASFVPLSLSWKDPSGDDPPVKKDLLRLADKKGRSQDDCIWFTYCDSSNGSRKDETAELLCFDVEQSDWVVLGVRNGSYPAPVIATK
jgi:hypothetical protein